MDLSQTNGSELILTASMQREPVDSSAITSVGYDPDSETLEIEFKSGGVYQYYGVPPDEHAALVNADTIGGYFSANIRDGYSYMKR